MSEHLLGIDVGTSSIKATIIDSDAAIIATAGADYELVHAAADHRQINTNSMRAAILNAIAALRQKTDLTKVKAVGFSCLCPGLTAFDEQGNVLVDPIIYSDQRSVAEAEQIRQAIDQKELFSMAANLPMPGAMSSTSMLWIKNNLPEVYEKTYCFGHVNTMLGVMFTGNFAIDRSNASYTLLFDTAGTLDWSDYLCEKIGIPRSKLPPLLKSTDVVGYLNNPEIIALGLAEGIPVIIGGGDTACASLATGVVRDGDVCDSVGTTDVLTLCVEKPVFRPEFINRCHVVDGAWIYQGAMSHIGSSLKWCRDTLAPDLAGSNPEADPFDTLTARADSLSVPGANGVVFLPYMLGERSPVWDPFARGVFFGLSLYSTRDDMVRAVLESAGYGFLQLMRMAEEIRDQKIQSFYAVGGGSKSKIWTQIKADITNTTITVLEVNDMAPIGAAMLAGVGAGIFADVYDASSRMKRAIHHVFYGNAGDAASVYQTRFQTYLNLYPGVKELYRINADM